MGIGKKIEILIVALATLGTGAITAYFGGAPVIGFLMPILVPFLFIIVAGTELWGSRKNFSFKTTETHIGLGGALIAFASFWLSLSALLYASAGSWLKPYDTIGQGVLLFGVILVVLHELEKVPFLNKIIAWTKRKLR